MIDLSLLCCPYPDRGKLAGHSENEVVCLSCKRSFQTIGERLILLDETRSLFSSQEIVSGADKRQFPTNSGWRYQFRKLLPAATSREISVTLLEKYKPLLADNPTILVLGCGFTGPQYKQLFPTGRVILSDVTLQGDADIACDGESLPFADQSLDCVVVDQVLEHTLNPLTVVNEIHRCLKLGGIVYSGIPFLTPVHGFPYDFQRYTPLGHRMLFRRFQELEICNTQGPLSAICKTLIEGFGSISGNLFWKRLSSTGIRLLMRPFLWMDKRYLSTRQLSVPSATAFLGRKQEFEESPLRLISDWSASRNSA
jgi:SAM-dependent methyltransferase